MPNCPVCQSQNIQLSEMPSGRDVIDVNCSLCGDYTITGTAAAINLDNIAPRWQISAAIRNRYENGERTELDSENIITLVESTYFPKEPLEYIDQLLLYVYKKTSQIGQSVELREHSDFPAIKAINIDQFTYIAQKARDLNFLERDGSRDRLSIKGWQRISELKSNVGASNRAFVAMWFSNDLNPAWIEGIRPAIEESGFQAIRIDLEEHNEKICDRIISEIRKSSLLIADFTGNRGGVYFEAGFALGLGIPVIWTCRADNVENLHFDTRQYNHIVWENPNQLKQKLINRISATIKVR